MINEQDLFSKILGSMRTNKFSHNILKYGDTKLYFRSNITEVIHNGKPGDTIQTVIDNFNQIPIKNFDTFIIISQEGDPEHLFKMILKDKKSKGRK